MAGLSVGVGRTKSTIQSQFADQTLKTGWLDGVIPQIRFGWVFIPNRLMISFENKQWVYEQGLDQQIADDLGLCVPPNGPAPDSCIVKLRTNVQQFSFALTWFPGSVTGPTGGLFLKAGMGWANARFSTLRPSTEEEFEATGGNEFEPYDGFPVDDGGLAVFGELGYELRIWRGLAAGLNFTYSYYDIGGEVFQKAETVGTALNLNWYWN
jgi:hypothetical protein